MTQKSIIDAWAYGGNTISVYANGVIEDGAHRVMYAIANGIAVDIQIIAGQGVPFIK